MPETKIKAASRSFSKNKILRQELIAAFPNAEFNDEGLTFDESSLPAFVGDAEGIVVGLEPINEPTLSSMQNVKIVAKYGVGLDSVDQDACRRHDVVVGWTGGVNRRGVAEMTLGFMLGLNRNLFWSERNLRNHGDWEKIGGRQLSGKTVGIIGVGFIGQDLVKLLKPFGCEILVNDIIDQYLFYEENELIESTKEEVYQKSDIITLHTPLDESTSGMIDGEVLSKMKETAFLINAARGGLVVQEDLKHALINDIIAGAALDVFEEEPCCDEVFMKLPNLYCTPHTGGAAEESILAMGRSAIYHLVNYFNV